MLQLCKFYYRNIIWIKNLDLPILYAISAGMLALVNPCGAAMLPAYIGYQLIGSNERIPIYLAVIKGVLNGVVSTLGFVFAFGSVGVIVASGGTLIINYIPIAGLVTGVIIVFLSLWLIISGRSLGILMASRVGLDWGNSTLGVFLFGVAYAIVSLSCALPIFLVVVVSVMTNVGVVQGLGMFIFYAFGMGLALILITIISILSKKTAQDFVKIVLPYVNRAGQILLLGAGIYIVYYWTLGTGGVEILFGR
jgi:cytochrome c biogenesis protein CcdA